MGRALGFLVGEYALPDPNGSCSQAAADRQFGSDPVAYENGFARRLFIDKCLEESGVLSFLEKIYVRKIIPDTQPFNFPVHLAGSHANKNQIDTFVLEELKDFTSTADQLSAVGIVQGTLPVEDKGFHL